MEENTLSVLQIAPGQYPEQVEIDNDLKALQQAVGGSIGATYPFDDPVAIVYNDDGKLMGLPLNRALRDEHGEAYDEPKQWELREINDIMNNAVTGWRAFSNPRYFPEPYRRQKGWERIKNDNEPDNSMDGFEEVPTEEMEQLGLPAEWLEQK